MSRKPSSAQCPGCGCDVAYTANGFLSHHYHGTVPGDVHPCAWNGRQRAVVEQEHRRMTRLSEAEDEQRELDARIPLGDHVVPLPGGRHALP